MIVNVDIQMNFSPKKRATSTSLCFEEKCDDEDDDEGDYDDDEYDKDGDDDEMITQGEPGLNIVSGSFHYQDCHGCLIIT